MFPTVEHQPTVERLEVHLEWRCTVCFGQGEHQKAKETGKDKPTKLKAWFYAKKQFPKCSTYIKYQFPEVVQMEQGKQRVGSMRGTRRRRSEKYTGDRKAVGGDVYME